MKSLLILLLLCASAVSLEAQVIGRWEMMPIYGSLQNEDWNGAFLKARALLASHPNDTTSGFPELLRYIVIFSGAGRVASEQMSYDSLQAVVAPLIGTTIKLSAHPTSMHTEKPQARFNENLVKINGDTLKVSCTATNKDATNILCFEYADCLDAEMYDMDELIGKSSRVRGVLRSVDFNPNRSSVWITRLHISDARLYLFIPNK